MMHPEGSGADVLERTLGTGESEPAEQPAARCRHAFLSVAPGGAHFDCSSVALLSVLMLTWVHKTLLKGLALSRVSFVVHLELNFTFLFFLFSLRWLITVAMNVFSMGHVY